MRRARCGMVMIEFTMAAVGLVAMAYVTVRVGQWLNDTMVERNASFQASRALAGRGPGVTPYADAGTITPLHLIGPHASQTPSRGTPGGGQSTVRPTCGDDLLSQANGKRWEILSLLTRGQAFTLDEQSQITSINWIDWNMLVQANYLANYAIQLDIWRKKLLDEIYPELHRIQNMDIVQGKNEHDICAFSNANFVAGHDLCPLQEPQGILQIDERLEGIRHELDPFAAGTLASEIYDYQQQANALRIRLWEIAVRLGQIGTRLPQIDTLLNRPDSDGPDGPDRGGIIEELRQLEPAMTTCEPILAIPPPDPFDPPPEYVFCSDLRDHVEDLERQRDDLLQEQVDLPQEQADLLNEQGDAGSGLVADLNHINNDLLPPLYTLQNYLWGEVNGVGGQPGLAALDSKVSNGWAGLYPQTLSILSQVDGMVDNWTPLWQELHPGDELWGEDLFRLFQDTITTWDNDGANSDDKVVLEQIPGDLEQIIGRLLEMMLERLDHIDWSELPWYMGSTDYIGQIPQSLRDRFERLHLLPLVSSDDVQDDVTPAGQREANKRVPYLMEYNERIRTLILEAEELERRARSECSSGAD